MGDRRESYSFGEETMTAETTHLRRRICEVQTLFGLRSRSFYVDAPLVAKHREGGLV